MLRDADEVERKATPASSSSPVAAVVFNIGRVIVQWDLRHPFAQPVANQAELDWFLANVVTGN